jgi:hypothetical protein
MNCHNVTIEPVVKNGKTKQKRLNSSEFTIWHEIKVGNVPSRPSRSKVESNDDPGIERRFSWVRGHYADYTHGKGLFGNPVLRVVFWIPEYNKGDKNKGEVITSYEIEPAS